MSDSPEKRLEKTDGEVREGLERLDARERRGEIEAALSRASELLYLTREIHGYKAKVLYCPSCWDNHGTLEPVHYTAPQLIPTRNYACPQCRNTFNGPQPLRPGSVAK